MKRIKTQIKSQLSDLGFEGTLHFCDPKQFGLPDVFGPAIHRKVSAETLESDLNEIMYSVERDGFETVVVYIERPRKSKAYPYGSLKLFTKSQVNGLTKALSNVRFSVGSYDRAAIWNELFKKAKSFGLEVDYNDASISGEKLTFTTARKITKEQTAFGKAWLRNYFFKLDGSPRSGKATEGVSEEVLLIAKSVTRFEFVGVLVVASGGWYPCQVLPVYRAYNRKGQYFDYAPVHWGQPVLMEAA